MENNIKETIELLQEKAKNMSILYVEDEELLRNSTSYILSLLFPTVEVAVDGKDGLDKYLLNKYDIVITDISMPNMDGLELIANIRKHNLNQEIIVMSAHKESVYYNKLKTSNISGYIYKPAELNQIIETLSTSIDRLSILHLNKV